MAGKGTGVELATAWIKIIPSVTGIQETVTKEMGGVGSASDKAGKDSGKKYSDGFASSAKAAFAAAGIGTAVVAGINGEIEKGAASNKLTAQLALSPEESARYGKLAGSLYSQNYGGSLGEVNDALKLVTQNVGGMAGASDDALGGITQKVMSTATAFDQDLGKVTTAVGQMMKTGMATDANQALDMVTKGLQTNGNSADDLLDTFTEYPALFQRLGISGDVATGIINQGMAAGARNTDLVADSLKEFQIRATDGSKSSAEAFKSLGLDAEKMTAQIAAGGPGASAGLDTVLDKLRAIEDPVQRNAAAVGLFGTQAEDLGDALFKLDPSTAVSGLGEVAGAADTVDKTLSQGTGASLVTFQRTMEGAFGSLVSSVLPAVTPLLGLLTQFAPILGPMALAIGVVTAAQWLWNAASLANPMTWILLGIVALIAGIAWLIMNWDTAAKFLTGIWQTIGDFFGAIWNGIVAALGSAWAWIQTTTEGVWNGILGFFGMIWDGIVWMFQNLTLVGIIVSHWDQIVAVTTTLWNGIADFFGGLWSNITSGVSNFVGGIAGFFSGIPGTIMGIFVGAATWLYDIGRNIVEGLLNGLRSLGSSIGSFFLSLLPGWIVEPFKAALGIHSPSTVFYDFGQNIGQGALNGVGSMEGKLKDRMSNLVVPPTVPNINAGNVGLLDPEEMGYGTGAHAVIDITGTGLDENLLAELTAAKMRKQARR